MGQVVLEVNGHSYTMQCNDGEEEHLSELGQVLDAEVAKIKGAVGQVGDIRLLLMAGLIVADRLSETLNLVEALEDQVNGLRESRNGAVKQGQELDNDVSNRIEAAASRIENITREMQKSAKTG